MSLSPNRIRDCIGLQAPIQELWSFFSVASNLATLTPPSQRLRVGKGGDQPIADGLTVHISVSPMWPIRSGWKTLIQQVQPPSAAFNGDGWFTDIQRSGPFALWHHVHAFRPIPGGTAVFDRVDYALPLGRLGQACAGRWVQGQIDDLFAYRKQALTARFGAVDLPEALAQGWEGEWDATERA